MIERCSLLITKNLNFELIHVLIIIFRRLVIAPNSVHSSLNEDLVSFGIVIWSFSIISFNIIFSWYVGTSSITVEVQRSVFINGNDFLYYYMHVVFIIQKKGLNEIRNFPLKNKHLSLFVVARMLQFLFRFFRFDLSFSCIYRNYSDFIQV